MNSMLKVPEGIFKNITVLNISMNRLKSLNGLEICSGLQFLNASQNQITTDFTIGPLQKLKELYLSQNLLSSIKEIANLRQLRTLDLSHNKFKDFDKLIEPLGRMHQLKIVDFQGNLMTKENGFSDRFFKHVP
jgi:Leucine-rich repeat (LRR) protein